MKIIDILKPELTFCTLSCKSKKRAIESSAQLLADKIPNIDDAGEIFNALISREKLGSTGFGGGVAIPHCRLAQCREIIGALVTLEQGIDFDAIDKQPVDIMFILLVPEEATNEHLQVLSLLAEKFQQPPFCKSLRCAQSNIQLYYAAIENSL